MRRGLSSISVPWMGSCLQWEEGMHREKLVSCNKFLFQCVCKLITSFFLPFSSFSTKKVTFELFKRCLWILLLSLFYYSCHYYDSLMPLKKSICWINCINIPLWCCSDTVECYNLKKNEWTFVNNMVEPHYGHAGTVHEGLMYISGKTVINTVKTYPAV